MPALGVVLLSQSLGLLLVAAAAVAVGEPIRSAAELGWGMAAGLSGATALVAFYRGLAAGRMGLVAPVAGVLGAAIPVAFGTLVEGAPAPGQAAGIGLALVSVLLVSRPDEEGGGRQGLGLALAAGAGFGGFFVLIDQVGTAGVLWPIAAARFASVGLLGGLVLVLRPPWRPTPGTLRPVVLAGVLDAGGNLLFLLAARLGPLAVAAVLSSLYPVTTVVLARLVLGERVARVHAAGIALAVVAIALIAAA